MTPYRAISRRRLAAGTSCLLLTACGGTSSARDPAASWRYGIEIVVRTPANFRSPADVQAFVVRAERHGVDTISLMVKQDEDGAIPSGHLYYPSALAPTAAGYEGFDVLQTLLDAAHPRGIRVQAWVPQFHDQAAVLVDPAWQMHHLKNGRVVPYVGSRHPEYFVNPLDPAVQAYQRAIVREIAMRYPIDGLMLDWIRFDDFPMDLGPVTRTQFVVLHGIDPVDIDFSTDNPQRRLWNTFRTDGIAAYVKTLRETVGPALPMGVYVLPPEFVEVGQDAGLFSADVQAIAPMCYHRDWGYPLEWVWNSCLRSAAAKAGGAALVPTMDSNLEDEAYARFFAQLRQNFPQVRRLAWFFHDAWTETMLARIARLSQGR